MGEFYQLNKQKGRNDYDRYKNCYLLRDNDTKENLISTREIKTIPLNQLDIYHTVRTNEENRLDIISDTYYKNPLLWWVIAQANDIYNPIDKPKSGDIIRIPSIITLYGNNGILL